MSDNNYDYECAFSAKRAEGAMDFDGDNLGDLPVGWIALTMKRRVYNPEWTALQQTKMAMVQAAEQQLPPNLPAEVTAQQRRMFEVQVKAQFLAMEDRTPPFITFEETIHVSPPETDRELLSAFNTAREAFGMAPLDESAIGILGWREGASDDGDDPDEEEGEESDGKSER
jgi:hypothetical protein